MKRFTLVVAVILATLALVACQEDKTQDSVIGEQDRTEAGRISLIEKTMTAKIDAGDLVVSIPFQFSGDTKVKGTYQLDLVEIGGETISSSSGKFEVTKASPRFEAVLADAPVMETGGDQARYILEYSLNTSEGLVSGYRSLFALLPKVNVVVWTPQELYEQGESAARIIVTNPITDQPIPDTSVELRIMVGDEVLQTAEVVTDAMGTGVVELKAAETGAMTVSASVTIGGQEEVAIGEVQVVRDSRVLVTTDKPLYQPGQKMYIRSLALRKPNLAPEAGKELIFEIEDAKGNKVFKQAVETNDYGIASTEFRLATQVNMGTYKIRSILGDVITEKTVTVDQYTLPKFKVDLALDKSFYQPGGKIRGEIAARYFFGKNVADGNVQVTLYKYEAQWVPDKVIEGKTNAAGLFAFDYDLPDYLVGQPLDQGKALVLMEVLVTDLADQKVTVARNLLITDTLLEMALLPESGEVVPGVENRFFLFVSDPTGAPAQADCTISIAGGDLPEGLIEVGPQGIASLALTPDGEALQVSVSAEDVKGNTAYKSFDFSVGASQEGVLVRTDKAIYKVGETIDVTVMGTGVHDRVYFDVIRKNQTILTTVVQLEEGQGSLALDLDNTMTEDLVLEGYFLGSSGDFVRDARVVYVEPANNLKIELTTDKSSYLPGETASLQFQVRDAGDNPAQAALGIQVVDEAVYALSELKPGLLKLYFQLEEELSNPSYQIGPGSGASFGQLMMQSGTVEPGSEEDDALQMQAEATLAAMGDVPPSQKAISSWNDSQSNLSEVLSPLYEERKTEIAAHLKALGNAGVITSENLEQFLAGRTSAYVDFWGNPYILTVTGDTWNQSITIASIGPDEKADTWDDWSGSISIWEVMRGTKGGGGWEMADGEFAQAGGREPAVNDENGPPPGDDENTNDNESEDGGEDTVRVRSWFPETLFVQPSLITGEDGIAEVDVPLADSITSWRVSTMASNRSGLLGSSVNGLTVFQDFFVDIDFPRYLTRGDEVRFPIAVYNYLETSQNIEIELVQEDWFELTGPATINLNMGPGEVTGVSFPVRVTEVGLHSLTIYGNGEQKSDAVQRTVEVKPDGQQVLETVGARFKTAAEPEVSADDHVIEHLSVPLNAVPNSDQLIVNVFPGFASQVVSGMDSMLQLPGGCFEQTTSSAWPNVLAMRYMIDSEQITPEIEMRAMEYINVGYQRILTFECASGGFNWWEGDDPGNAILGAVAVMMLTDTKAVYGAVDQKVIDRTAQWLGSVQQSDGTWTEETHLHAGNENLGAGSLRATCYITWALAHGGFQGDSSVSKAVGYINSHLGQNTDFYTKAMCANALAVAGQSGSTLSGLLEEIDKAKIVEDDMVHWSSTGSTLVNSYGNAADVEVSSLAALAFIHAGVYPANVTGAVNWLVTTKDPQGNWGYNTQATVLALKTFVGAATANVGATDADVTVYLNGEELGSRHFDSFNGDVVWQVESSDMLVGENVVELDFSGYGNLSYQIVSRYHLPWEDVGETPEGPLSIDVSYDSTDLQVNDQVTCTVTLLATDPIVAGTVLVDLGLPPGFSLVTDDLIQAKSEGLISEYETTGKQLLLYVDGMEINVPRVVTYRLTADYPVKAQSGPAQAYVYYNKEISDEQAPTDFQVEE